MRTDDRGTRSEGDEPGRFLGLDLLSINLCLVRSSSSGSKR